VGIVQDLLLIRKENLIYVGCENENEVGEQTQLARSEQKALSSLANSFRLARGLKRESSRKLHVIDEVPHYDRCSFTIYSYIITTF